MPHYMSQFSYTMETWRAFSLDPQDRRQSIDQALQSVGGHLINLYYSFGEYSGIAIFEAPDDIAVSAVFIAASAAGHLQSLKTTKLLTMEEALGAMKMAGLIEFQAPVIPARDTTASPTSNPRI